MSNHKVYLALYKGKKEGRGLKVRWARFRDWLVRTVTRSPYSHCEIAVTVHPKILYTCYSASARDGGVRCKVMALPAEKWDLIPLPESCIQSAVGLYARHKAHVMTGRAQSVRYSKPRPAKAAGFAANGALKHSALSSRGGILRKN